MELAKKDNGANQGQILSLAKASNASATHGLSGFSMALAANLLWGTSFLASKQTLTAWGPFTASALRFVVALLAMWLILPLAGHKIRAPKLNKESAKGILLVGLTGFGVLYPLQLAGLTYISSGLSAAIMLTSPLFVLIFNAAFFRESISIRKICALILGLLGGVVLLSSRGGFQDIGNFWLGSLLTLGASVSLALSVIATRKAAKSMDAANITFWSIAIGLLMLLPFSVGESVTLGVRTPSTAAIGSLIYLGVLCSAVCFWLWNAAIAKSSPLELATTMHVKTPAAVVLGIIFAGEALSASICVGTLIVASGVWISQAKAQSKGAK